MSGCSDVRRAFILGVAAAVTSAALVGGSAAAQASPGLEQLVGHRLVVAMQGTSPSRALLERARRGEIAGVILFGPNVRTAPQVRALTGSLQAAAKAGGQPPLLVMADQEGGVVRRLRWAPPVFAPAELGKLGSAALRDRGAQTGRALRAIGINVDLAPVADVPAVPGSFIAASGRAFSRRSGRVAAATTAFAAGLADAGVAATFKHFPGLGFATVSTDAAAVTIDASSAELEPGLAPYRRAIREASPALVMLSNASYSAYGAAPGAWSPRLVGLLRSLGFRGVTLTDALEAAAATHGKKVPDAAVLSLRAGVDLVLLTGSEATSAAAYRAVLDAARSGKLSRPALVESHGRVVELARSLE